MPALPNIDADFHMLICQHPTGPYFPETGLRSVTFMEVVRDVATQQIDRPVLYVLAFNPVEGWSRDVTEDVALAVAELVQRDGSTPGRHVVDLLDRFDVPVPRYSDAAAERADYRRKIAAETF